LIAYPLFEYSRKNHWCPAAAAARHLLVDPFVDWLLLKLNIPPEAYDEAREYCIVCFQGMLFIFGYNIVSAILRGMGNSKYPLMIIIAATVINLILDLLFVGKLNMGVRGAALATIIGQGMSFVGSMIYLLQKKEAFGFDFKPGSFIIDFTALKFLLKLGIPLALQFGTVNISKLFVSSWINSYGLIVSAVNGIGTKIGLAGSIVTNGFGSAGAVMIGQNFGAGKTNRIVKIIYISFVWGLIFTLTLSIINILFPEQIFRLFNNDPRVLAMSHDYVIIAVLNFIGFALRTPMMALMNGLGNGRLAIVVGILDGVVARVGLAMLMGISMGMGFMGFWYGNVLAGYIPFVIGGIYFWSGLWKKSVKRQ
jgi:putative MATE family efflux protein